MKTKRLIISTIAIFTIGLIFFQLSCKKDSIIEDTGVYGWTIGDSIDGYGTIIYTSDGGENWIRQGDITSIPNVTLNDVCAVDKNIVWVVGEKSDGYATILKTTNGGKNWERLDPEKKTPNAALYGISAINNLVAFAVGENGIILKTIDGGNNWDIQTNGTQQEFIFEMVSAADENTAWAVGRGETISVILNTINGGQRWERQGLDVLDTGDIANNLLDVHALDNNTVWAVGAFSQALYTSNGGANWQNKMEAVGNYHNNGVCAIDQNNVWVATDYNTIKRLHDLDSNWVLQLSPEVGSAMYMGITAMNNSEAWIVPWPFDNKGYILHTTDGGDNWIKQTSPVEVQFRKISFAGAKR